MNEDGNKAGLSLGDALARRCAEEGIRFEQVETESGAPAIPASFLDEATGPWPKVIGKLEARYGVVPVYDPADPNLEKTPSSLTQVGRFLYLGRDRAEIDALRMLADGDEVQRSAALDYFGDDAWHAVPLFLALQSGDRDAQVRIEATQKLQFFPTQRVVDGTVNVLGDNDEAVQAAARATLVWIGDEQVLQAVRVAANSADPRVADIAESILQDNLER